jgi:hypothetical protein
MGFKTLGRPEGVFEITAATGAKAGEQHPGRLIGPDSNKSRARLALWKAEGGSRNTANIPDALTHLAMMIIASRAASRMHTGPIARREQTSGKDLRHAEPPLLDERLMLEESNVPTFWQSGIRGSGTRSTTS